MNKILLTMTAITMISSTVQAEPRHRNRSRSHNYIIERQEAYQVQGAPQAGCSLANARSTSTATE
jgi:hypothetical protein